MNVPATCPGRHLAIVGPTASAKSAVAMALAVARNEAGRPTEIVSCDSMQVYRHMDIGTAKPTSAEQREVRHHLIDLVEPTEEHNLGLFLDAATEVIADVEARGAHALLVGGTGLYVRGVVDALRPPPQYPEIAAEIEELDDSELARRLRSLDPVSFERCEGNRRRMIRALEVTIGSGRPFSEHGDDMGRYRDTPFVLCGLCPPREQLANRIDERYRAQLDAGLLGEVEYLHELGDALSRTAGQALGYRELLAHMRGEIGFEEAMTRARQRTRRFAVRQIRWFRRDPRIAWSGSPDTDDEVVGTAAIVDSLWRKREAARVGSVASVGDDVSAAGTTDEHTGEVS